MKPNLAMTFTVTPMEHGSTRTEIPSDRSGTGFAITMVDRNNDRIAAIVADLSDARVRKGSNEQRIRDLYKSFADVKRVEKLGIEPLQADLDRIANIDSYEDVAAIMGDPSLSLDGPFGSFVWIDSKKPDTHITWVGHSGLGLPDKSYYERDDERTTEIRNAYHQHIATMLGLVGYGDVQANADAVFELEKTIAALHWSRADRRDANRTYNLMDRAGLEEYAAGFPWDSWLESAGLGAAENIVVQEKEAFPGLAALFAQTPVETWKAYLTYQLLASNASYLSQEIDDANFAFYGKTLRGQEEQRERHKRAIDMVNGQLDQAVGKLYIERFFPEESKVQMTDMFENVRSALKPALRI